MAKPIPVPSPSAYAAEPIRFPALTLIDLDLEASQFPRPYYNAVLNKVNQHCLRLASFEGIYPWHRHPQSDELFVVLDGELFIDFPDQPTLCVRKHQAVTIPAGRVHRTRAEARVTNLCFEELAADTEFMSVPEPK